MLHRRTLLQFAGIAGETQRQAGRQAQGHQGAGREAVRRIDKSTVDMMMQFHVASTTPTHTHIERVGEEIRACKSTLSFLTHSLSLSFSFPHSSLRIQNDFQLERIKQGNC